MHLNPYAPLFHLTRGQVVESIHYGAIAVVDARGALRAWAGNPQAVTYLRSSAKPFQALPFVEHGGLEAYGVSERELALMCASHAGTDEHKRVVEGLQAKTGVQESDLLCGIHPLQHQPTVQGMSQRGEVLSPNRHNCSGKHTGMVAYARLLGLPYHEHDQAYIDPGHPIQQEILCTFAEMCEIPMGQVALGTDGCSAPNFAVPLHAAARAYARLCQPDDLPAARQAACRAISSAMYSHPDMVGGPNSFDTALMSALPGKVVCKGGAEGYQALGILPGAIGPGSPALGVCFKVSDGDLGGHTPAERANGHARPAIALEILRQLGVIDEDGLKALAYFGPSFEVLNWRKVHAGQAYPCFKLEKAT